MKDPYKDHISINFHFFLITLWREKTIFITLPILIGALGIWYSFTLQEQFISEGKILPELQTKGDQFGSLEGLASLAGVDLSNMEGTDAIRPDLYPDVLKSTPFFLELLQFKVITQNNKSVSFESFYYDVIENKQKIDEKDIKKFPIKEEGFLVLNHLNELRIKDLKERIKASIDKKTGIIIISVKMPDPVVAASVARFSMTYLTNYITSYRTTKEKKDLDFLESKVNLAQQKFYNNQSKKAKYSDQFQLPTIRLQAEDLQRERIEAEYRISSSFYNELLKKYEEAKIKLQQETPVFQILEPPIAPTRKSEPKKAIIVLISIFLGIVIATIIILVKDKNYKSVVSNL